MDYFEKYVDQKLEASDARIQGSLQAMHAKLDAIAANTPSKQWMFVQAVAVGGIMLAAIIGVMALWGSGYIGGFDASSSYSSQIAEQDKKLKETLAQQDAQTASRLERLELAIDGLAARTQKAPAPEKSGNK